MNMRPFDPLDEEERALAALIAREGPHGEPSPALDAKILAAAHSAVAARPRRTAPRWPLLTGVAASALLAVGIAWQMRPAQESTSFPTNADAPMAATETAPAEPPAESAQDATTTESAERAAAPPPATAPATMQEKIAATPVPAPPAPAPTREAIAPRAAPVMTAPPPPPAADVMAKESAATPVDFVAEPPHSAAPARAATQTRQEQAQTESTRALSAKSMRARAAAPATDTAAAGNAEGDSVTISSAIATPALAATPITEDEKLSRRKWLQRIEQRHAQGDLDGARESLRRFVAKYPRTELPDQLQELREE
ncbi:MAG: hypothetical protein QM769_12210 [Pseudoxanthomonas sp.]